MKKEIMKASDELARRELVSKGNHAWATIKPERNNITKSYHKLLDTLARILNGNSDVCVAVYYDDKQEELIIANN